MPSKKQHADDDLSRSRTVRDPEMCVDYLSYRFDEMDLAASWRVMTKQKKEVVNGIRLENASWRTWAKHKYNLKTVSPETLNWLKDSDVTWLYGPLHTVIKNSEEEDRYAKPKGQSTEDTLGLMTHAPKTPTAATTSSSSSERTPNSQSSLPPRPPLKSALKRVTTSDLLRRSATELPLMISETPREAAGSSQTPPPVLDGTKSSPMDTIAEANKKLKVFSPSVVATHRQPKLRFNMCVEQCIALGTDEAPSPKHTRYVGVSAGGEDDDYDDSADVDSDDSLYSDDENAIVLDYDSPPRSSTIKKIAPARLKTSSQSEQETDDVSSLSSSSQASSFTKPQGRWEIGNEDVEEEDSSSEGEIEIRRSSISGRRYHHHRLHSGVQARGAIGGGAVGDSRNGGTSINDNTNKKHTSSPQAIEWVGQTCVYNHQPSDYDDEEFAFADDWDTQDDNEYLSPPLLPTAPTLGSPPPVSCLPPGQHNILAKAMPVSGPCVIDATEPSLSRGPPQREIGAKLQKNKEGEFSRSDSGSSSGRGSSSSSNNNSGPGDDQPSFLGSFAQWASSYLWSSPKPPSSSSRQ